MKVTDKQQRFVDEYLVDLNATQAAIRAGYSERTAVAQASRLLRNVNVAAAIAERQAKLSDKAEITQDRVVAELAALSFYDPADIVKDGIDGPEDIAKLPEQVRRAIIGWGWDKAGNFTLKLSPKTPSLDMLAKHLGMFREQIDVSVKTDLASLIAERRARARAK